MAKERAGQDLSQPSLGRAGDQPEQPEWEKLLLLCPGMEVTHAEELVPNAGENWPSYGNPSLNSDWAKWWEDGTG
jgi:hypothetical protein